MMMNEDINNTLTVGMKFLKDIKYHGLNFYKGSNLGFCQNSGLTSKFSYETVLMKKECLSFKSIFLKY